MNLEYRSLCNLESTGSMFFLPVEFAVLTAEEACRYLRLDVGREDNEDAQIKALNRLVDQKKAIRPCLYQKRRMYLKSELDRFLQERQQ